MASLKATHLPGGVTAVTAALSAPELLELVLLRLDLRTLLTSAQLVNHQWRELITNSPALQRALFFRPVDQPPDSPWTTEDNPLLVTAFPPFFGPGDRSEHISFYSFYKLPMAARLEAFTREQASWRRMLPMQPPATKVGFCKSMDGECGIIQEFRGERYTGGLTMGRLYDVVLDWNNQDVAHACIMRTRRTRGTIGQLDMPTLENMEKINDLTEESDIVVELYQLARCCPRGPPKNYDEFRTRFEQTKLR